MKKVLAALAALLLVCVAAFMGFLMLLGGADSAKADEAGAGAGLTPDSPVPDWVRPLIKKNAGKCPQVTESLLAAQLFSESTFDKAAKSDVGALGIAQFMPATWAAYGVDGNGDGKKDVFEPADAIAAQAHYDCVLAKEVKSVPGDSTDNMLAAYNAGGPAVKKFGGIPPFPETRDYVKKIRQYAEKWAATAGPSPLPAGKGAARAIAASKRALGTWYQWGGDCVAPYTGAGGCDCSSLTKMAWAAGGVNLPRVTYDQVNMGTPVKSMAQLRPGDLLFSVGSAAHPEHVGMYIGDSKVIDAPHTGAQVRIKPLSFWIDQVLAMRHIA